VPHPGSHTPWPDKTLKAQWNESGKDVYEVSYRAHAMNGNAGAG